MREIKFRGKYNKTWVYGYYLHGTGIIGETIHQIEVVSGYDHRVYNLPGDSVGQFTGLKDKKGKEVYEGDIMDYGGMRYKEVIFKDGGYYLKGLEGMTWLIPTCDIIGNIYENPELLK